MLNAIKHPDNASNIAGKINLSLGEHYELSVATLSLSPSIGNAVYPDHGKDTDALIRYADSAMYQAKNSMAMAQPR